jgi:RNA polymerase-binding transcription factor DksA
MKKKPVKKTNKVKVVASKKAAPKKVVKKSKPAAKKIASAKKKIEKKKPIKAKQKPEPKKTMKKVEAKKAKPVVKKAPVVIAKKEIKAVKPAPKVEIKTAPKVEVKVAAPVAKVEPKKAAPAKAAADEKQRYNEKELAEFKTLIVDKLDQAKKDYELLKNTLCHTDDHGTDDTSPTFKALEDGSDVLTREETAQLALRQEKFIQNLQNALVRIQNKTYGICRVTGKLIPKERLQRVPHATLSIDAKLVQQFNQ